MAVRNLAVSSVNDVLSALEGFAGDLGWATGWSDETLSITPKSGDATFSYTRSTYTSSSTSTFDHELIRIDFRGRAGDEWDYFYCTPIFGPTHAWLAGGNDPEPWCFVTLATQPGKYVHFYLGFLERYGDWEGGAICDAMQWSYYDSYTASNYTYYRLFNSFYESSPSGMFRSQRGALDISALGLEKPFLSFQQYTTGTTGNSRYYNGGYSVSGGYAHEDYYYGWRLAERGVVPFTGQATLAPFIMFGALSADRSRQTPLGVIPGVRMINCEDFVPGEIYSYGGEDWRVFPLSSVSAPTSYTRSEFAGNSGIYGIAVLEAA